MRTSKNFPSAMGSPGSVHDETSINYDLLPGYRSRPGTCEEQHCACHVFWRGDLPEWRHSLDVVEDCLRSPRTGVRRLQEASRNHIHCDTLGPQIGSASPDKGKQCSLGCRVVVIRHDRVLEQIGSYIDDAAEACPFEPRQCRLRGVQSSPKETLQLGVEIRPGQFGHLGSCFTVEFEVARHGIIHDGGDRPAEASLDHFEKLLHLSRIRDIGTAGDSADFSGDFLSALCRLVLYVVQDDLCPFGTECFGNGETESAGRSFT